MKKNDHTRDTFAKVGEYDDVENVSGAPWQGSQMVRRPRTITPPRPGRAISPRRQRMINAQSGETLDAKLERGLSAAAQRHLTIRETVDQSHPSARPMLRHIFGLNLPGRDRA